MHDLSPSETSGPSRILVALQSRQWLTIFLAPLVGLMLLRAPVVNDVGYIDTWFYSGYGWALPHHIDIFGWLYYADRFTVILPIALSTSLFGAQAGYLLLHYAILVGTGGLLYSSVRRFARPSVAATAVVLLALDPFYFRLVLWDYTTFVALPATIAGAALWYLGTTRRQLLASASGSGAVLACALFANPLSGFGIAALFAVEEQSELHAASPHPAEGPPSVCWQRSPAAWPCSSRATCSTAHIWASSHPGNCSKRRSTSSNRTNSSPRPIRSPRGSG